jgi:hypothetical protein
MNTLPAGRNLYRLMSNGRVVAFVTGRNEAQALTRYQTAGGAIVSPNVEQLTHGYPVAELKIYN